MNGDGIGRDDGSAQIRRISGAMSHHTSSDNNILAPDPLHLCIRLQQARLATRLQMVSPLREMALLVGSPLREGQMTKKPIAHYLVCLTFAFILLSH